MSDAENFLSRWSRRKREILRETETVIPPPEAASDKPAEKDRVPPHTTELMRREHQPILGQHKATKPDRRNAFVKCQHGAPTKVAKTT
jgi:hypothetical protein